MEQYSGSFFQILCASLHRTPVSHLSDADLNPIWQELQAHAIQNLAVDTMAQLDPQHQAMYIRSAAKGYAYWRRMMALQHSITLLFDQANIPFAVLKGSSAAIYYPEPTLRSMGDIDILVRPKDFDRALAVLVANDFLLRETQNPKHAGLIKDGIPIELHRHFATISTLQRVEVLDNLLFDALDRREKVTMEGYSFYQLPDLENGLVLMEHINSHMESGLGLRQIIDWMYYAHRYLSDPVWAENFGNLTEQVGLSKLAMTVTRMCQLYLGLREDITWCHQADPALCHRLMEHTLQQGNFGTKQEYRTHATIQVLTTMDSDLNVFQILQQRGCYNWKALKRHPWLKPFAWLYQLLRYGRKALRGGAAIPMLRQAIRGKKDNIDLMQALEVQRKDHALQYDTK